MGEIGFNNQISYREPPPMPGHATPNTPKPTEPTRLSGRDPRACAPVRPPAGTRRLPSHSP